MLSLIAVEIALRELVSRLPIDIDAVFAYGIVAILVGLIWWNKYTEPELSPPYPPEAPDEETTEAR